MGPLRHNFPRGGACVAHGAPGSGGEEGVVAGAPPAWSPRAARARGAESAESAVPASRRCPRAGRLPRLTSLKLWDFLLLFLSENSMVRARWRRGRSLRRRLRRARVTAAEPPGPRSASRSAGEAEGREEPPRARPGAAGAGSRAKLSPLAAPPSRCLRRPLGAPSCRLALSRTPPAAAQLSAGSGAGRGRGAAGCSPRPAWAQPADAARGTRRAEGGRRRRVRSGGRGADRPRGRRGRAGGGGGAAGTPGPPAGEARPPPSPGGRCHRWPRPRRAPTRNGGRGAAPWRSGPTELPPGGHCSQRGLPPPLREASVLLEIS